MLASVNVPNIDGKIWNIEHKILDILHVVQTQGHCVIDLNSEGPCCKSLGLYDLLDNMCDKFKIDSSVFTIHTCNQLEKHDRYRIIKHPPLYIDSVQAYMKSNQIPEVSFDNEIKHFALFVGRSNWQRLQVAGHLYHKHRDKSLLTYHLDISSDFHRPHIGLDDVLRTNNNLSMPLGVTQLLSDCPLTGPDQPAYPIITPAHFAISSFYKDFFMEIVCETYCQGNSFYPTEKIWRPLANKKPFLVLGAQNYYHNLHALGFKTFSNWWDEGFTNDDYVTQVSEVLKLIDQISSLSQYDLESWHIDMQETLEHNQKTLQLLGKHRFAEIWS